MHYSLWGVSAGEADDSASARAVANLNPQIGRSPYTPIAFVAPTNLNPDAEISPEGFHQKDFGNFTERKFDQRTTNSALSQGDDIEGSIQVRIECYTRSSRCSHFPNRDLLKQAILQYIDREYLPLSAY